MLHNFLCSGYWLFVFVAASHLVEASRILGKRGRSPWLAFPTCPATSSALVGKHRDKIHHDYRLRAPRLNLIPNCVSEGSRGVLSLHPCPPLLPCIKQVFAPKGRGMHLARAPRRDRGQGCRRREEEERRARGGPPLPLISRADHSSWTLALLTCILLLHHYTMKSSNPDVPPSSFLGGGPRKCSKAGNCRCTLHHWRTAGHLARPACYLYKEYPPPRRDSTACGCFSSRDTCSVCFPIIFLGSLSGLGPLLCLCL